MTGKDRLAKYAGGGDTGGGSGRPVVPRNSRPTTQDSLNLYNNATQVLNYYRGKGYREQEDIAYDDLLDQMQKNAKEFDPSKKRYVPTKNGKSAELAIPKSMYRQDISPTQFKQREFIDNILDTRSPMQLFDTRIKPTKNIKFTNTNANDPLYGDMVGIYGYDPEVIKPAFMRSKSSSAKGAASVPPAKPKPAPPPELNPTKVQGIIPTAGPNVKANVKGVGAPSNKSNYSVTYRDPGQDSKQQTIYFPDKNAWQGFIGTGALNNVDTAETEDSAHATGYYSGKYAGGGEAGMFSAGGGGWGAAGQLLPEVGNLLQTLFTKPQQQNNQPIVNAQTAKNMTSPYAMGGELDDVDDYQYQNWLQAMFNNQLASEYGLDDEQDQQDEQTLNEGIDTADESDEDAEDSFAMGGKAKHKIHINPKNKGKFNALKKRTGKTTEQLTHSKNPLTRKRAIFAQNAAKWKHAYGGPAYANGGMTDIEVEGDEVVQTPDGQMQDMQGPSHEQGGIPMSVPVGTKIYSDRLQVEGKTMQERKKSREKKMADAQKTLKKNPHDITARGTYDRTKQVYDMEEQQDMALQKVANKIYSAPRKAAYGDEVGPWHVPGMGDNMDYFVPDYNAGDLTGKAMTNKIDPLRTGVNAPVAARTAENIGLQTPTDASRYNIPDIPQPEQTYSGVGGLTTGDYIGMAGNLFNAVAPIINTKNAARATKPEVNRFQGFGKQAMDANQQAQTFAGVNFANSKRDLDTATNSAVLRNRLGARSVNTQRALDTVTDINRNKAAAGLYGQYTNEMSGLLTQEGQLANQRDQAVMSGATARDQREAQNRDNYYSNMAQNLTNLGTNISNIGGQLNKHKANQDNADLISQLSEYFDFGRDSSGKLVLKNKGKR